MRRYFLPLSFFLVFLLPYLLFGSFVKKHDNSVQLEETVSPSSQIHDMIIIKDGDIITEMELDAYLLGVLLGEVPADFEEEALKAQAVASRTYTLRKVLKKNKHVDATVCTDASCCQAFIGTKEYLTVKGNMENLEKMENAVKATADQVLTYQGDLIEATYFSCSGGMTEDAVAVWGASVPYLKSVSSPGEEASKHFESEFYYTTQEFLSKLRLPKDLLLSQEDIEISHTAGGGVDQMTIAEVSFSGTQLRSLLGLPSTNVTISVTNEGIAITAKGNGHRVGMSQYGAEAMAVAGRSYDEILSHYYPGTKLETLTTEQMQAVFDKGGNL